MGKGSRRRRQAQSQEPVITHEQAQEYLWIVRDDLSFLRSQDRESPSPTDARFASSVLRRLLYEGTYGIAWALARLEGDPRFECIDLLAGVADLPPRYIQYAYAGGAMTMGAHHFGQVFLVIPKAEAAESGEEAVAQRVRSLIKPLVRRKFPLSEFCTSPSVIAGSATVSRVGLVRYVANKLGGVHWDNRRGAWTHPVESRHRFLDEKHLIVGRLLGPLYEVVSIAHAVAFAEDTDRLLKEIGTIAPEHQHDRSVMSFREGRTGKYADMTFGAKQQEPDWPAIARMHKAAVALLADAELLGHSLEKQSDGDYLLRLTAFEILLKALLRSYGAKPANTHAYQKLFEGLPANAQESVLSKATERVGSSADLSKPLELLTTLGKNFVSLRYPYQPYEGMTEEEVGRRGADWVATGAPLGNADFVYHPEGLFALTFAVQAEVELALGHATP